MKPVRGECMTRATMRSPAPGMMAVVLIVAGGLTLAVSAASAQDKGLTVSERMLNEQRVALVIGNAEYKVSPLRNPVNDAKSMAAALKGLGFDVTSKYNQSQKEMKRAIQEFGKQLMQGGVGLFYYSGHGMQVDGRNYLIPVGAVVENEADVDIEAVRVAEVLAKMEGAGNRLNIVILDACRNNPFASQFRSQDRGLSFMNAPTGTLIAYATAPGSAAQDGDGKNGVYTSELIRHIKEPGLTIEQVFKKVRTAVKDSTGGDQVPWESTALEGEFYFKLPEPGTVVAEAKSAATIPDRPVDSTSDEEDPTGSWTDPATKLTWQDPPAEETMEWEKAKQYCQDLSLGGHTDWRLPTISELRSLIRGCPGTVTGGVCKVTDSCLSYSCSDAGACFSCSAGDGPAGGCYWPDEMQGTCLWYWSSSPVEDYDNFAWYVDFYDGIVYYYGYVNDVRHVRCLR